MTSSHTLLQIKGSLQIQRMETTSSSHRQALTCLGCRLHTSLMGLKCPHHPPSQHLLMGSGFYPRTHFQRIPFFFPPLFVTAVSLPTKSFPSSTYKHDLVSPIFNFPPHFVPSLLPLRPHWKVNLCLLSLLLCFYSLLNLPSLVLLLSLHWFCQA